MYGKKYSILYFGRFDNKKIGEFYNRVVECMDCDSIPITNMVCGKIGQASWSIRKAEYVKKRYEKIIKNQPNQVLSISLMNIEDNVDFPPSDYLFDCGFSYDPYKNNKYYESFCSGISIDYSIIDKVSIDKYRKILRECSNWYKEVIFKCGIGDVPLKYAIFQKTNHFKRFKLISEVINEDYKIYSGDNI